jgi:thiol-disulfide isomerase/thioredoxin
MANFIDVLRKYISPYYYYIIAFVIFVIFLGAGIFWYNRQKDKTVNRFKDVANTNRRNKEAIVYFFHVDWCPHCKTAEPEWNAFKTQYDGKEINGYVIKCNDINCTDEDSNIKYLMNQYKIESFPTIKLVLDDKTIDFDSKITRTSLGSFVNTML